VPDAGLDETSLLSGLLEAGVRGIGVKDGDSLCMFLFIYIWRKKQIASVS
jgi:hypothetical protein